MSDGLLVLLMLLMALRESVKMMVSWRWRSVIKSRALIIANASAVKIEQELGSLYMNSMLFQTTAAPTPIWLLDESVYIFSHFMFCIMWKYSCL